MLYLIEEFGIYILFVIGLIAVIGVLLAAAQLFSPPELRSSKYILSTAEELAKISIIIDILGDSNGASKSDAIRVANFIAAQLESRMDQAFTSHDAGFTLGVRINRAEIGSIEIDLTVLIAYLTVVTLFIKDYKSTKESIIELLKDITEKELRAKKILSHYKIRSLKISFKSESELGKQEKVTETVLEKQNKK